MIHHCSYCNYKSNHKWVVTRHVNNVHKNEGRAPTSILQPKVGNYSAKEMNYQHESNNQVPYIQYSSKTNTNQQYNPQIQYNEARRCSRVSEISQTRESVMQIPKIWPSRIWSNKNFNF